MIRMKTDFQTMVTCNQIKCKEVQGAVADVTLAGALVTFSPASSARDGGAGAFIGDEALLVLSGVMPVAILRQIATEPKMHRRCSEGAFVTLDGALVTFVI